MTDSSKTSAAGTTSLQATRLYAYGVIPGADAGGWPDVAGIGGPSARVWAVEAGELAALVSPLPPRHTPGRREDLDAYRSVLSLALERGTVIPLRFGMVMEDEDVVRERLLRRHGPELTELMRRVDGQVQMTVRALYAEGALLRGAVEGEAQIARLAATVEGRSAIEARPERIALGEMVAAAVEARRAQDGQALLEQLEPLSTDLRVDADASERVAITAQLLIARDRRAMLDEVVRRLRGALEGYLALRYIGPMPPYSFSELSLERGEERWGS